MKKLGKKQKMLNQIASLEKANDRLLKLVLSNPELAQRWRDEQLHIFTDSHFVKQLSDNFFLETPVWSGIGDLIREQAHLAEQSLIDTLREDIYGNPWTYDDVPAPRVPQRYVEKTVVGRD